MDKEREHFEIWCKDCNTLLDVTEEHICSTSDSNICDYPDSKNDYLERLIAAVFEKEPLWNSTLPYKFRGPSAIKTLWTDIDCRLGTAPGTSQTKWKNIRDRFVKEYNLVNSYIPSGSAAKKKESTWSFYESLRFLEPTVNYRRTISNIENVVPSSSSSSVEQSFSASRANYAKKDDNLYQPQISQKRTLLRSPLNPKQNYSSLNKTPDTDNSDIEIQSTYKRKYKKARTLEKKDENYSYCEEAILRELERTKPTNQSHAKPDKIESFTKYLESCLRSITADDSKRIINQILKLIAEADV